MENLQYPIGKFESPETINATTLSNWIDEFELLPQQLRAVIEGINEAQLDTCYREGGWSVRQVVHHIFDGHCVAYGIYKLTLTESNPMVMPYDESKWAELFDARTAPVSVSLDLLDGLHKRWVMMLRAMNSYDFARTFLISDSEQPVRLDFFTGWHAWHGKHHLAQIGLVA